MTNEVALPSQRWKFRPPPAEEPQAPTPLPPAGPAAVATSAALSAVGMALFGAALRAAVPHGSEWTYLGWAAALPASSFLAWAVSLPALYIFWVSRQPTVGLRHCLAATLDAQRTHAACLASTSPILWFFAVTAPRSELLGALGFAFTGLAAIAGGVTFGQSFRQYGGALPGYVQLGFMALVLITFAQFALASGLRWF